VNFAYTPEQLELRERADRLAEAIMPFEEPCDRPAVCPPTPSNRSGASPSTPA
jgi:hypothetical protein